MLRIAGLLHVVNQQVFASECPIPAETMQAAIEVGYYFLEHARAAYQLMGADSQQQEVRYILGKIAKHGFERGNKTYLVRICRKYTSTEQLTEPLAYLIEAHYLRQESQPNNGQGGQPEPIFVVNPLWKREGVTE